jgi:hypothetical protein
MYFWVDEVLNVFVLGKPNFVPLYPGYYLFIYFGTKSLSSLKLLVLVSFVLWYKLPEILNLKRERFIFVSHFWR